AAFAKIQAGNEKLGAPQKAAAGEVEKKLTAVADARKAWLEAAQIVVAQADDDVRQMEVNAASLADKIASRKRALQADRSGNYAVLDDSERQRLLEVKRSELSKAQQIKASADAAARLAEQKLAEARARSNSAAL